MGWSAARKLRRALDGLTRVLAIELLTAARGIELRAPLRARARHRRRDRRAARDRAGPGPTASSRPRSRPPWHFVRDGGAVARRRIRDRPAGRVTMTVVDPIRAARGTELSCLGWQQEAALRMLQNNLDPEVAEHPRGARRLRRHRQGRARLGVLRRDRAHAADAHATTRRCSCSPASRSACMQTHEWAPRVLLANSNLVGDWANWDEFRRLEALGLTMYGQMTAGSWIYIGTPGHPAGHLRDVRGGRGEALRRLAGGDDHADRRPRRDGRRAAARGDDGRRRRDLRRGRPVADRAPARAPATSTSRPTTSTTRCELAVAGPRRAPRRCRSACSATAPTSSRSCSRAARRSTS